jgi:hypothetical protein
VSNFVGLAQASQNAASGTATINLNQLFPTQADLTANTGAVAIANGDFCVGQGESFNTPIVVPSGFTSLGCVTDYANDDYCAFDGFWNTGAATSFNFTGAYPEVMVRCYSGISAVDHFASAASGSSVTTFNSPALAATATNNEIQVVFFGDNTQDALGLSADLGDVFLDQIQWAEVDGDVLIPNAGTVPPAQTATDQG